MNQILKLAEIFAEYKLYPSECFDNTSIAHIFQSTHSTDNYSKDLHKILLMQQYKPEQRGADLPYWGNRFFQDNLSIRVMVISQDSNALDAGSVVFHACLWPYMEKEEYKKYIKNNKLKAYAGYDLSKDLIQVLDLDYIYITDASKVYKKDTREDKNFDKIRSKELIEREISICDPDLIILLGNQPMKFMGFKEEFKEVCNSVLISEDKSYIIAPFPSRRNRTYATRVEAAKTLFRSTLEKFKS